MAGQGGGGGNEAGLPSHELDESNAIDVGAGLHVGGGHRLGGLLDGSVKAEGPLDEHQVVVNSLWHPYNGHPQTTLLDFLRHLQGAPLGSVSPDDEEHIHVQGFDGIHNVHHPVAAATARPQEGASRLVDVVHQGGRQVHGVKAHVREEALEAEPDATDAADSVAVVQAADDGTHHIVQAGAEATAGADACVHVLGVEVDVLPRPRLLNEVPVAVQLLLPHNMVDVIPDALSILHIVCLIILFLRRQMNGRQNLAGSQLVNRKIIASFHDTAPFL